MVDERERTHRAAQAARRAAGLSPEPEAEHRPRRMPGTGHTLSGSVIDVEDEKGLVEDDDDDDEEE